MTTPSSSEPTVPWKIFLPTHLAAQAEILTMDPKTEKPRYGARSRLISRLLSNYMKEIGFMVGAEPLTDEEIDAIGREHLA